MVRFTVNPSRRASYKRFKFRVILEGRAIPGVSRVGGLRRVTEAIPERDGNGPNAPTVSPGRTTYDPIVLERGLTHDPTFEDWANEVHRFGAGAGAEMALDDYRKNLRIELHNEAGQVAIAYHVVGCWPSEYRPFGDLDADDGALAVESLTLHHDGWERDADVTEPDQSATRGKRDRDGDVDGDRD